MDLLGVSVVGRISTASNGRRYFRFTNPIDGSILSSSNYKKRLNKLGYTFYDIIIKLNDISYEDIPLCPVCGSRVKISGDIITPRFHPTCGKVFCGQSYANRIKMQNGWMPPKPTSKSARKAYETQKKTGTFILDNESADDKFKRFSKLNKTKWKNGNHPAALAPTKHVVRYKNKKYLFRSDAELTVFNRYKRFLYKYYNGESYSSTYSVNGEEKSYHGDFNLKSRYRYKNYPDVIEVKSYNLFSDHRSSGTSSINYLKYKSVIESGKSLLIIDVRSTLVFHKLNSISELNNLFKR